MIPPRPEAAAAAHATFVIVRNDSARSRIDASVFPESEKSSRAFSVASPSTTALAENTPAAPMPTQPAVLVNEEGGGGSSSTIETSESTTRADSPAATTILIDGAPATSARFATCRPGARWIFSGTAASVMCASVTRAPGGPSTVIVAKSGEIRARRVRASTRDSSSRPPVSSASSSASAARAGSPASCHETPAAYAVAPRGAFRFASSNAEAASRKRRSA